ncbi:TPA: methyltransferase domain-containing protein [Bacillus pseudomycoides]|nr:methyltransferase domain-containing protein [Bacillus pseudomycoides]
MFRSVWLRFVCWEISNPVHIVDYSCGYGYLGLKLLPLLPKSSRCTGIDKGQKLINDAKKLFQTLPSEAEFIVADVTEIELESKYDIAVCHAFLLHMTDPLNYPHLKSYRFLRKGIPQRDNEDKMLRRPHPFNKVWIFCFQS